MGYEGRRYTYRDLDISILRVMISICVEDHPKAHLFPEQKGKELLKGVFITISTCLAMMYTIQKSSVQSKIFYLKEDVSTGKQ